MRWNRPLFDIQWKVKKKKMPKHIFYYVQHELGSSLLHPNAFIVEKTEGITVKDVREAFPLRDVGRYHIRFRMANKNGFIWMDNIADDDEAPQFNGGIFLKVLDLDRLKTQKSTPTRTSIADSLPDKFTLNRMKASLRQAKHIHSMCPVDHEMTSVSVQTTPTIEVTASSTTTPAAAAVSTPVSQRKEPRAQFPSMDFDLDEEDEESDVSVSSVSVDGIPSPSIDELFSGNIMKGVDETTVEEFIMNDPVVDPDSIDEILGIRMNKKEFTSAPPIVNASNHSPTNIESPLSEDYLEKKHTPSVVIRDDVFIDESASILTGTNYEGKSSDVIRAMKARELDLRIKQLQAISEIRNRDEEEARTQEAIQEAHEQLDMKLREWSHDKGGDIKNIRSLLVTLNTVLWEGAGVEPIAMSNIITAERVKLHYRKVILKTHPDKNGGKTPEQICISQRVFDALNCAWAKFQEQELGTQIGNVFLSPNSPYSSSF